MTIWDCPPRQRPRSSTSSPAPLPAPSTAHHPHPKRPFSCLPQNPAPATPPREAHLVPRTGPRRRLHRGVHHHRDKSRGRAPRHCRRSTSRSKGRARWSASPTFAKHSTYRGSGNSGSSTCLAGSVAAGSSGGSRGQRRSSEWEKSRLRGSNFRRSATSVLCNSCLGKRPTHRCSNWQDEGVGFDAGEMKESERCNWILALEGEQRFGRATNV